MSQSLESVLGGSRPRAHMGGAFRVDQHGRLVPQLKEAHSMLIQQDPRRFSEAGIAPPPRPPLPNIKRLNLKVQRKPLVLPASGPSWSNQMILSPPAQTQPQNQFSSPQPPSGSNLMKMAQLARSSPQLDEEVKERDRDRAREKTHYAQITKESIVSQVEDLFYQDDTWLTGLTHLFVVLLRWWRRCMVWPPKRFILHFSVMTGTRCGQSNNSRSDYWNIWKTVRMVLLIWKVH